MPLLVKNKIIYLSEINKSLQVEIREALQNESADEVYFDSTGKTHDEIISAARLLVDTIKSIPNLFQPLVFGPLKKLDRAGNIYFAKNRIAITPLPYDQYCDAMARPKRGGHTL